MRNEDDLIYGHTYDAKLVKNAWVESVSKVCTEWVDYYLETGTKRQEENPFEFELFKRLWCRQRGGGEQVDAGIPDYSGLLPELWFARIKEL